MDTLYFLIYLAGAWYILSEINRRIVAYKVRLLIKKCKQFRLDENTQKARTHTQGQLNEYFQKLLKAYQAHGKYELLVEISMYVDLIGFKLRKYILQENQIKNYSILKLSYAVEDLGLQHFCYSIMQVLNDNNDDAQLLRDVFWTPLKRKMDGLGEYFKGVEKSYFEIQIFWIDKLEDWFDELEVFRKISKSGIPAVQQFQDTLAILEKNALLRVNELLDDPQLSTVKLEILHKCVKSEGFIHTSNYFDTNTKFYEIYEKHQNKLKEILISQ